MWASNVTTMTVVDDTYSGHVEPQTAARTKLSGGPLVEGAVVAAVQASAGDDLATVVEAAEEAANMPKDVG